MSRTITMETPFTLHRDTSYPHLARATELHSAIARAEARGFTHFANALRAELAKVLPARRAA